MQTSVVDIKKLVGDFRLDAESYLPIYFEIDKTLNRKRITTLNDEASLFSKGIFDIKADCYMNSGGVPFVRINNLGDCLINDNDIINIPFGENEKNKKTFLKRNDLILSKTAYPAAALVDIDSCNTSQDTIAVKLKKNSQIISHFLVVFLNCKYGFLQMQRWFTGNVQMHLNLTDSKGIRVIVLEDGFQRYIQKIIEDSIKCKHESIAKYRCAEQILLSELGLADWKPKHRFSFIRNFSDTQKANRIDAEYFQPMYEEISECIKQYKKGYKPLSEIVRVKDKNFQPKDDVTYRYIELANISANGNINGFIEAQSKELPTRARRKVNAGDVIVSTIEGALSSIALINDDLDNALCSTGFFVINSEKINSETLLILLKSLVGQLQLKKGCSGTILTAIGDDEFKRIILPDIPVSIQSDIKKKISEMYNAKALSKRLLDIAKRGVELAIEKTEKDAENWIEAELKKLNVDLT